MELGIAFQKAVIELIQDGFCQFCVFSGSAHIIFVSHLEYHFVKRFFLISIADFLVVIFNTTVFAFLLGIVFSLCFIEQLMVRILDRCVAILDVQMGSCCIYILCNIGAAVMSNNTVTGHSTDCSFNSCHLHNCGIFSKLVFAARRRVLLLLSKVTQKHF